ncbi:MAG: DMT family transporter, partial [Chlamydiae bacterium]|nr:DMT family transporter [Chlamydiota bacterium]
MSLLLVVALFATWSSVFSLGKLALAFGSPLFLTSLRMLLAAALILPLLAFKRSSSFRMPMKQWLSLGLLGLFSIYLANICEFWGLQYLSAAKTCFIYSLSPFFTALFSFIHFKEKVTGKKWLGFIISFLGILPVLFTQTGAEELFHTSFLSLPTLSVIGASLFSVYGWILLRLNLKNSSISPLMANGTSMLFGGGFALIHSLFVESWTPVPVQE